VLFDDPIPHELIRRAQRQVVRLFDLAQQGAIQPLNRGVMRCSPDLAVEPQIEIEKDRAFPRALLLPPQELGLFSGEG
jgi:hypothetical protein